MSQEHGSASGARAADFDEQASDDALHELIDELKLLAESMLERVEPVLRRASAHEGQQWKDCAWCPVCATAALLRGEQHDALATIAEHGTAIVTVLREALAGAPVDPVMPHERPAEGFEERDDSEGWDAGDDVDLNDALAADPDRPDTSGHRRRRRGKRGKYLTIPVTFS